VTRKSNLEGRLYSQTTTQCQCLFTKLWQYTEDGEIQRMATNRNTIQQGIFVHRLSWALSEGGAILGFCCISLGILLSLVWVCFSSRMSSASHSASSPYTSLSVNPADWMQGEPVQTKSALVRRLKSWFSFLTGNEYLERLMEILTERHCFVSMTLSEGKRDKLYMNEGFESHDRMGKVLLRLREGPGSNYGTETGYLELVFFLYFPHFLR
jgi:hypothetical protein